MGPVLLLVRFHTEKHGGLDAVALVQSRLSALRGTIGHLLANPRFGPVPNRFQSIPDKKHRVGKKKTRVGRNTEKCVYKSRNLLDNRFVAPESGCTVRGTPIGSPLPRERGSVIRFASEFDQSAHRQVAYAEL